MQADIALRDLALVDSLLAQRLFDFHRFRARALAGIGIRGLSSLLT